MPETTYDPVTLAAPTPTSASASLGRAAKFSTDARVGRLEEAITNPGAVKINVKGAFIVEEEEPRSRSPVAVDTDGVHYENKDIRLPHHKSVVSHVAVDVSVTGFFFPSLAFPHLSPPSGYPPPGRHDTPELRVSRQRSCAETQRWLTTRCTTFEIDWRVAGETGLLYARTRQPGEWRPPKLHEF